MLFKDRVDAGKRLATLLKPYAKRPDVIALALPRGGVPVAAEIAHAIEAPLDVLVVRKLGVPGSEETAMGAIASGGFRFLNQDLIEHLKIPPNVIETVAQHEQQELVRREAAYRDGYPPLDLRDRTVILVDDGLATGATVRVAIAAIKEHHPKEFIVAVPVASEAVCEWVGKEVDHIICAETPRPFYAVGLWYKEFSQTSDEEVQTLLRKVRKHRFTTAGSDRP